MAEKLSELQLLEFKEAFTTFDKVYHNRYKYSTYKNGRHIISHGF